MSDLLLLNGLESGLVSATLTQTEFDEVSVVASGTLAASTTVPHSGSSYALNAATGATNGVSYGGWDWGSDEATIYVHMWVRFAAVPAAITAFASIVDSAGNQVCSLRSDAAGHWQVYNNGDATAYTGTGPVIIAGLFYRVELKLF